MGDILFSMFGVALVGGVVARVLKFFQWFGAVITVGIFFDAPTWQSTLKLVMIFAAVGAIIGLINGLVEYIKSSDIRKFKREHPYVWLNNDEISIYYRIKPPHFKNVSSNDMFATCGFCKYYNSESGCEKYGVICYGVDSVAKTRCDDFKISM